MTKHKNVALDELRILAALMVLGVHTGQKVGLGDAAAVGAQGVQLFFLLSGYLAAAPQPADPAAVLAGAGAALAVRCGTLSGGGRQCSPAVWPRRAVRAGLPAVLCIFADVAAQ